MTSLYCAVMKRLIETIDLCVWFHIFVRSLDRSVPTLENPGRKLTIIFMSCDLLKVFLFYIRNVALQPKYVQYLQLEASKASLVIA